MQFHSLSLVNVPDKEILATNKQRNVT